MKIGSYLFIKGLLRSIGSLFVFVIFFQNTARPQVFHDVTLETGTSMIHDGLLINEGPTTDILHRFFGSGACWIDYNNDGWLDLYLTRRTKANILYKNNGDGTFVNVAVDLGVDDPMGDGMGVSAADFNNDGWQDLYVCNGERDRFYKNVNGTHFVDIFESAGFPINEISRGTSATWGDYDNDGYLDLYVSHHMNKADFYAPTTQDWLYHNNGDETFTDVSSVLGEDSLIGSGFIGGWTDFDKDGDLDLIVINDCPVGPTPKPTLIFRNDGGTDPEQWNFTEVAVSVGVDDCRNGMGIAIGDYNRDGWMDMAYSNIGPTVVFKNDGGTFQDVTTSTTVDVDQEKLVTWGSSFFDYDLDGWLDLLFAGGFLRYQSPDNPTLNECQLFKNDGNGTTFTDISESSGFNDHRKTRNVVSADYDLDGDLDLYLVNYYDTCVFLRNDQVTQNRFLSIELEGVMSNRNGIGSFLKLTAKDNTIQYYETRSGSNLGGGDTPYAHFGLGLNDTISELKITWPSGIVQTLQNIQSNQHIKIVESSGVSTCVEGNIFMSPLLSGDYSATSFIKSKSIIVSGEDVEFSAFDLIELLPGFTVENNGSLVIEMEACQP